MKTEGFFFEHYYYKKKFYNMLFKELEGENIITANSIIQYQNYIKHTYYEFIATDKHVNF